MTETKYQDILIYFQACIQPMVAYVFSYIRIIDLCIDYNTWLFSFPGSGLVLNIRKHTCASRWLSL